MHTESTTTQPGAAPLLQLGETRRRAPLPADRSRSKADHICARQAICFQCFRAGVERARARRQAWSQRALPLAPAAPPLTPREIAHRQRMLDHLAQLARRA